MPIECAYSFKDLYFVAFGKQPSKHQMAEFGRISLAKRQKLVNTWTVKAGWETKDQRGSDGLIYTAFCPKFN